MAIQGMKTEEILEITVMDNGMGMSEEKMEYIQKLLEIQNQIEEFRDVKAQE